MRKLIDVPEDILNKLDHYCLDQKPRIYSKQWIENLVIKEVNKISRKA